MSAAPREPGFHAPVWDRGEPIDGLLLAFTVGDDPLLDRRLVVHDLRSSLAHADGLLEAGLLTPGDHAAIRAGLERLARGHAEGEWDVEPGDEDVHSAVERRLIALVGEPGKRLHTGRSRNDQVATDVRLWLRAAVAEADGALAGLLGACRAFGAAHADVPVPGYTHLRRGMPSRLADWIGAHARAFEQDGEELAHARARLGACPLGSGAGYGIPLPLARESVARALGFERPEEPVTLSQHARGRAELAYLTALEAIALDLGKLASDLWLFTTREFGFLRLPVELTTGSSLMPHKRNPDGIELLRAHARQVVAERAALLDVLRDLPSGYHRDFQLLKAPLFRAHDRMLAMLPLAARFVERIEVDREALERACADESLRATERALLQAQAGRPFRDAYRDESRAARS
jgi:argininosuccinate lyase